MKKMIHLLTATILLFSACDKNKTPKQTEPEKPFFSMNFQGQVWKVDSINLDNTLNPNTMFTFSAVDYGIENDVKYPKSRLSIGFLRKQVGKQRLTGAPIAEILDSVRIYSPSVPTYLAVTSYQEHGHFLCEQFQVDNNDSLNNWIEITKQEGGYKKIWGKFQVTIFREGIYNRCDNLRFPERFTTTSGQFYLELP